MLFTPLYNAFNNGSRGFAVSSQLPGCLLLFWVAYFPALAHVMNNSAWLCAAKPDSIFHTLAPCVDGLPFISALHGKSPLLGFKIGTLDTEAVTHGNSSACVRAGHYEENNLGTSLLIFS